MNFKESLDEARAILGRAGWDEAHRVLDHAESIAADDAELALVAMHRASIPVLRGDANPDLQVFRENIVRRHTPRHVAIAGYYILIHVLEKHDRASAERYLPTFLDAVREMGDSYYENIARDVVATYESLCGEHDSAIERQRTALAELESYDGPDALLCRTTAVHNLAYSCLAANRVAEALRYANRSLALGEQLGRPDFLGQILLTTAFANLCSNRLHETQQLIDRAAEFLAGTRHERYVHYVRGEVARRRGDLDTAAAHFERLEELYPDIPGVAEILLSMNVAPFLLPE